MIKLKSLLLESTEKYIGYHGTNVRFRRFSLNRSTQGIIWFTSNKQEIIDGNVGAAGKGFIITAELTIKNPADWDAYHKYSIGELKGLRHDGVILDNTENDDKDYIVFSPSQIKILKIEKLNADVKESYYDKMSDQDKYDYASKYFDIGQDEERSHENYCWIWDRNTQSIRYKMGGTHGMNFTHEVAGKTFKGWYDTDKNIISIVFPDHELNKIGDRKPTVDDIPTNVYNALVRTFGKRKPNFAVFESQL